VLAKGTEDGTKSGVRRHLADVPGSPPGAPLCARRRVMVALTIVIGLCAVLTPVSGAVPVRVDEFLWRRASPVGPSHSLREPSFVSISTVMAAPSRRTGSAMSFGFQSNDARLAGERFGCCSEGKPHDRPIAAPPAMNLTVYSDGVRCRGPGYCGSRHIGQNSQRPRARDCMASLRARLISSSLLRPDRAAGVRFHRTPQADR